MLRSYLEEHSGAQQCELQGCVARKLLSMGASLPQWMIDRYKVRRKKSYVAGFEWGKLFFSSQRTNPAELLRFYLTFDLVEAATNLAMEHIDAVMGHGKEYFGLEV